ncbi:sensor histidine kinase [Paenibacillus sp. NPDC058177]|uniref:sensor histidine kinase n=1 Tax=Paenibacillus sp. NPDC058177 TaxID=3346369 RepID=UPI0036D7CB40
MKFFNRLIVWVVVAGIGVMVLFSIIAYQSGARNNNKPYIIEANRLYSTVQSCESLSDISLPQERLIRKIEWLVGDAEHEPIEQFFNGAGIPGGSSFIIKPTYDNGHVTGYLRFTYHEPDSRWSTIIMVNIFLGIVLVCLVLLLLFIQRQIISPFHTIEDLPLELSKGNLNQALKEHKSRFFGKFIWGLNLLRETLRSQKQMNYRLEKDRQTLIASLSHEIKTPVSAIKLYATALYDNLYESEEKRSDCARMIEQKAIHIEKLIAELMTTSVSSLSDFNVQQGEFYLSKWVQTIKANNAERLALLKIQFDIAPFGDKLLQGDFDRFVEIVDTIIDNAIKYGDGNDISISFLEEDYRQLVRIENSGLPISPNELPHMFTSFWRGSNASNQEGNGLGLYICRQLLRKMGGDIFAEASEEGMAIVLVIKM